MEFNFGKKQAILFTAVLVSTILCGFFLQQAVGIDELFSFDFMALMGKLYVVEFWLFVAAAPLPVAITIAAVKQFGKRELMLLSTTASALGLAVAGLAFPALAEFWVAELLYIVSIPLAIETASLRFSELKSWVLVRGMGDAFKKSVLLIGLGLLLTSFFTIGMQQEEYAGRFESSLLGGAISEIDGGNLQGQIAEAMGNFAVQNQLSILRMVVALPTYSAVAESSDVEDVAFVESMEELQQEVGSPAYKQRVKDALDSQSGGIDLESPEYAELFKKNIPFFSTIEEFLWLFYGLFLFGVFSLIGNIVMVPLAIIYGLVFKKILIK